jgi:hypothetical protein
MEEIDAFRTGRLKIGDSEAELGFLNMPVKSYLPIISKMIRKCNSSNNGVYDRNIDNLEEVNIIYDGEDIVVLEYLPGKPKLITINEIEKSNHNE